MSRRQATLFSLIGEMTALSTMWESWRNARMARSTPWRAILAMLANSRAIQWEAVLYTVTVCLFISRKKAKEYQRFIPLALLLYIKQLRSLREWINLCRSIYPEAHPSVSAWYFWHPFFLEICTGR